MNFINNYINNMANVNFLKKDNGEVIFFPYGIFAKGRLVQDLDRQAQLYNLQRRMIVFGMTVGLLCALLIFVSPSTTPVVLLFIALHTLLNIVRLQRLIRDLPKVDDKCHISHNLINSSKAFDPGLIKFVLAFSVFSIGFGLLMLLIESGSNNKSNLINLLLVISGTICLLLYSVIYKIRKKACTPAHQKTQVTLPEQAIFSDNTPAISAIVFLSISFVCYFILDYFFWATEVYAQSTPISTIMVLSISAVVVVYFILRRVEPSRGNIWQFAILFGVGAGLAGYAFILRVNQWTDNNGLASYRYYLAAANSWQPENPLAPVLTLDTNGSDWWRQFSPGDHYDFELRKGGLDIWQINMSKIHTDQIQYYKCRKRPNCNYAQR